MSLYIGLMSGTSMDGIDAAIVDMSTNTLICGITKKYSDDVKRRLDHLLNGCDVSLASVCQLNALIGREFAEAANHVLHEAQLTPTDIRAIGSHGQTVCHDTKSNIPYTLQLGCGHTIALLTGITVVADFRTKDLVNGGEGAPFAPVYHQELFKKDNANVAVVNIGGIANITFITANEPTIGWDVGPGNCLMDAWINKHHGQAYDADGAWAKQGMVIDSLLTPLLNDSFIRSNAPKSIGKEYFSLDWLIPHLKPEYQPEDIQKTLLALTAKTIADTVAQAQKPVKEVYLCGGGTHNGVLHQMISDLLPTIPVKSIAEAGVSPDYLEAMMLAWLAAQTLNKKTVDLRAITGSKRPVMLGAIYPSS